MISLKSEKYRNSLSMKLSRIPLSYFIIRFVSCLFLFFFILGFRYLPFSHSPLANFQVNAEYTSSILTGSSILYGFWGFVFASKPTEKEIADITPKVEKKFPFKKLYLDSKKFTFETLIRPIFFMMILLLIINVLFIVLVSVNLFSEGMALIVTAFTFFLNAFFLWLTLDNYVFK